MKAAKNKSAPPHGNGELILMVDDEPSVLTIAGIVLGLNGYRLLTAGNAIEAAVIFERQKEEIAAVIVDLAMPGMDGMALSRVLIGMVPCVKIIVSSGHTTPAKELELQRMGVQAFLPKPYNVSQLLALVHRVIHPGRKNREEGFNSSE